MVRKLTIKERRVLQALLDAEAVDECAAKPRGRGWLVYYMMPKGIGPACLNALTHDGLASYQGHKWVMRNKGFPHDYEFAITEDGRAALDALVVKDR